jgi:ABC-2 type transport system ATP-binding protein
MSETIASVPGIELTHLAKAFGKIAAVRDLSLSVPDGATLGFLGPNGAGKTTTIKMIMGLLAPTSGRASVLGLDPAAEAEQVHLRVGYVPEEHLIYRWMKVGEVTRFCRSFYPTWNDALCGQLLDRFKLPADRKVKHLSKGMLAKLSLLLAVAHEPEVLILDEPVAGLDPLAREEFLEGVLATAPGEGRTVLFSSHILGDVERLADAIAILHEGRLLVHCRTDELLTRTKRVRMVLGEGAPPAELLAGAICQRRQRSECVLTVVDLGRERIEQIAEKSGLKVIEVQDIGLEEVFKDYVTGQRATP